MIKREKLRKKPSIWLVIILVLVSAYALMPVGNHFASSTIEEEWWILFRLGYPGLLIGSAVAVGLDLLPRNLNVDSESIAEIVAYFGVAILLALSVLIGKRSYYHLFLCCFVLVSITAGITALLYYFS